RPAEATADRLQARRNPADEHAAVAPAAHVAHEVADEAVEVLDRVRAPQCAVQWAGAAEALEREGLLQPLAQGGRRAGVGVVETGGELLEAPLGERGVRESIAFLEHTADARPHGLWQMLEDVAAFVDLAALDDGHWTARVADRLAESGPAVDHKEHRPLEIEAALAHVGEEGLADGRVLGRALAQREDVLAPLSIHAQRDEDDVIAEVQPVEEGQRQLHRGDGRGRERFPGGRSCATLLHGGSFRKVVVTAVLPWTAEGAAAPSSARQFNTRRDIPGTHRPGGARWISR